MKNDKENKIKANTDMREQYYNESLLNYCKYLIRFVITDIERMNKEYKKVD